MRKKLYCIIIGVCVALNVFCCTSVSAADILDRLDEIDEESKERVKNSVEITTGDFYDTLISIYPSLTLTDYQDGSCAIELSNLPTNSSSFAKTYMWVCARIIADGSFPKYYDSISIRYFDGDIMPLFSVSDYNSFTDFTVSFTCVALEDTNGYKAALDNAFERTFYNFTTEAKSARKINEIAEESGISTRTDEKNVDNDFFWLFSSFPVNTPYSFLEDEQKAAVNLRDGMSDSYESGQTAWEYIDNAAGNYKTLISETDFGFSFDTMIVICFDGDSEDRLMEIETVYQDELSPFKNTTLNFFADEFEKGVRAVAG